MFYFFFNDTATTEIYTLSLHDALPISIPRFHFCAVKSVWYSRTTSYCLIAAYSKMWHCHCISWVCHVMKSTPRSEEHTSELQSRPHLVCRLLLEKKKTKQHNQILHTT